MFSDNVLKRKYGAFGAFDDNLGRISAPLRAEIFGGDVQLFCRLA